MTLVILSVSFCLSLSLLICLLLCLLLLCFVHLFSCVLHLVYIVSAHVCSVMRGISFPLSGNQQWKQSVRPANKRNVCTFMTAMENLPHLPHWNAFVELLQTCTQTTFAWAFSPQAKETRSTLWQVFSMNHNGVAREESDFSPLGGRGRRNDAQTQTLALTVSLEYKHSHSTYLYSVNYLSSEGRVSTAERAGQSFGPGNAHCTQTCTPTLVLHTHRVIHWPARLRAESVPLSADFFFSWVVRWKDEPMWERMIR